MAGGKDTPATRALLLVDLLKRLPVFATSDAAMLALRLGQRPRPERPLRWLTDAELADEREQAQIGSDAASLRLDNAIAEQDQRAEERRE